MHPCRVPTVSQGSPFVAWQGCYFWLMNNTVLPIIRSPTHSRATGTPPKTIGEFIGHVTSGGRV